MEQIKAIVIGAGFSGLSSACFLAQAGFKVKVFEKNSIPGGRARKFTKNGFTFDMGPSWYWMPDVMDRFFASFGKKTHDFYQLQRLDPSYRIVWGKNDQSDLPADFEAYMEMFEKYEKGSGEKLKKFLKSAEFKYKIGINKLVYKKSASPFEFIDPQLLSGILQLNVFSTFHNYIRKYFSHPKLLQILEFPVLFLGGTPKTTPALYSLMNYGDIKLGTWYPQGGMYKIIEAMVDLATTLGVEFEYNAAVESLKIEHGRTSGVLINKEITTADVVVASADYQHVEQTLLPPEYRTYTKKYWDKRVMSPSSLIFYLGINKELQQLKHHTLFFDEDFDRHAEEIYTNPQWPEKPSIYVSNTSKTDKTTAPDGMENLMVLIPVAPDLNDTDEIREKYFKDVEEDA